jgi:hypothetical protein
MNNNISKIASCIRNTSTWAHVKSEYKFDSKKFNKTKFINDLPLMSPKIHALIENFEQINWKYFIKYQPVKNKEFVLNSLLLGYDSNNDSFQQNTGINAIANHYINLYLHLLEGRASTNS